MEVKNTRVRKKEEKDGQRGRQMSKEPERLSKRLRGIQASPVQPLSGKRLTLRKQKNT